MKQYCLIHSQLYSASSKNGFPLHHTTCYMCPPSKNDWDCWQGLNSPQSWGWSLWANDSSRDTQHSETDCQGTSDGPNNPPGTSLPDPAMTHQVETTKGKTGAAKEGRAENAGIWVKGHVEERTQLYVPTQFRRYTWWDIRADQEWTIGQLGYQPVTTAIDSTAPIWLLRFLPMLTISGLTPLFLHEPLTSYWHHYDIISTYDIIITSITMTSSPLMTSSLHHYDFTFHPWPHFTPLWHHR